MSGEPIKTNTKLKIKERPIIAIAMVFGTFAFLFYVAEKGLTENEIIMLIVGQVLVGFILVIQFFFRRAEPQ